MSAAPPAYPVFVGKRPLEGPLSRLGFQHWGIKVGDNWYEIQTKDSALTVKNQINVSWTPGLPFPIVYRIGTTTATADDMKRHMQDWLKKNEHYRITDQNCQYWVYETLRKLGFTEQASAKFLPQLSRIFGRSKITS
jgi:hypothetical protein